MRALDAGGGSDLVDRLVHERYRDLGAVTITLDDREARLEGAEKLHPDATNADH